MICEFVLLRIDRINCSAPCNKTVIIELNLKKMNLKEKIMFYKRPVLSTYFYGTIIEIKKKKTYLIDLPHTLLIIR